MELTKQRFIKKWSSWWQLRPQGKELTSAFEKELDELIEKIIREKILKDELK